MYSTISFFYMSVLLSYCHSYSFSLLVFLLLGSYLQMRGSGVFVLGKMKIKKFCIHRTHLPPLLTSSFRNSLLQTDLSLSPSLSSCLNFKTFAGSSLFLSPFLPFHPSSSFLKPHCPLPSSTTTSLSPSALSLPLSYPFSLSHLSSFLLFPSHHFSFHS